MNLPPLHLCIKKSGPYFKIFQKGSPGNGFWDWFLGKSWDWFLFSFHFWNLNGVLCLVPYSTVVIRSSIYFDNTHILLCGITVHCDPQMKQGGGTVSGIKWDKFISAFQNTVWTQYNSLGQLWNETLVLEVIRYFVGTDCTEEYMEKMFWQVIEFEVAFTSPT